MTDIVRYHEIGGPEVLKVEQGDPGAPGDGEVLIAIEAIGLNRSEAAQRAGTYIVRPPLPARLGHEAAGTILAVGANVTGWQIGDAVSTLPPMRPGDYGTYAGQTLWPATQLIRRPEGLSAEQAAASWVAFLTAYGGLCEAGGLRAGQPVVISAASSSVGLAAIQIARAVGAIPIATTRQAAKRAALEQAGAAYVVISDEQDVVAEIRRATGGAGAPLIFDPVAGPFAERLMECLAPDGMLIVYGGLSNQPATFPRHLAIGRNLTMRGYNFFPLAADAARRAEAMAMISAGLEAGRFDMPVAARFALAEVGGAHRALEANAHIGKMLLIP
ncbi:zinc-dependent alcohol dehydrogenase family protein [Rhizorhabdus dicambivorans]|uniref:NADPH:quinone reductase n=1 Tax=Rhizorhabdus dicambivorans TaxID=1850238 RepID=A0A2A4FQT1_9SPHN|nr:zinc-dependent alcohol dehydrogenase family protein [Rhizorhabdus dicambivorans]ATE64641.1 NADPH:quinone reductase [Rhizorhabdus dicambivorans]PCE40763.1 NADPH:quinone reductase [Rhizorhabdus dicambivorans]